MTGFGEEDTPNVARIYDHLLGGAHNFAVDRAAAAKLLTLWPTVGAAARANRTFLRTAVEYAVGLGIRQFLDLGAGIPTVGSVHEVARREAPEARVAYVDNDPVAVAHTRTLLHGVPDVTITEADLREPDAVLAAPGVAGLIDFSRPVAVLMLAALHFTLSDDVARSVILRYRRAMASGSILAVSHASTGYPVAAREQVNRTQTPVEARSPERLAALLGDLRVNGNGMTDVGAYAREVEPIEGPLGSQTFVTAPLDR